MANRGGGIARLRSRVSRRILATVTLCTLLPIVALVGLTFYTTEERLEQDTARRLRHASKNIGMAMMAELVSIENELRQIALMQQLTGQQQNLPTAPTAFDKTSLDRIWLFSTMTQLTSSPLAPSSEVILRLQNRLPQLSVRISRENSTILLWVPIRDQSNRPGIIVGQINNRHLREQARLFLPRDTKLQITDAHHRTRLLNRTPSRQPVLQHLDQGFASLEFAGEHWLAADWELFLAAAYNAPSWHITVYEPRSLVSSELLDFRRNAALTALMTFWLILLASCVLIRQILHPLTQLTEATRQISRGRFDLDLAISSHDEFAVLATSFTGMARKIQHQIRCQKTLFRSVRDIFGENREEDIIQAFFKGLADTLDMAAASLVFCSPGTGQDQVDCWIADLTDGGRPQRRKVTGLSDQEYRRLYSSPELFVYNPGREYPTLEAPFEHLNARHLLHFNIAVSAERGAVLTLVAPFRVPGEEALTGVRQLADQLGIALSRAAMLKELDVLNMGILTALARTVDANSPWTRGHSERVMEYALAMADALDFSREDHLDLQRASLLHDLGKISIPSEVLNKPGPLTDQERLQMENHPVEGDRIIEPIPAFSGIRAMVRQHHERWDGKGYPDGLQGEQICLGARILAVADVYDALYSDRPYREGWPRDKVIAYLRQESGKAFDPRIVAAFLETLQRRAA